MATPLSVIGANLTAFSSQNRALESGYYGAQQAAPLTLEQQEEMQRKMMNAYPLYEFIPGEGGLLSGGGHWIKMETPAETPTPRHRTLRDWAGDFIRKWRGVYEVKTR